jgi:cytidyltransferase-like protein
MVRVYCDGIFDLFHNGHLKHFEKIHSLFENNVTLIVGIIDDKTTELYKRKPMFNESQRLKILQSVQFVQECFITNVLKVDEEFLKKYNIDYIVHAFNDTVDKDKQSEFFEIPIKLNKFIEIPYNSGVSTTQIIKDNNLIWSEIWEKKGSENTEDLLNGSETTALVEKMIQTLGINKNESILEIGCGAGLLSSLLKEYDYIGTDTSMSMVCKNITLNNTIALHFSLTDSIFKEKYFNWILINSVLEDIEKGIQEIERISKNGIYIANIRFKTVIEKSYFSNKGYVVVDNDPENRYDAYKLFINY